MGMLMSSRAGILVTVPFRVFFSRSSHWGTMTTTASSPVRRLNLTEERLDSLTSITSPALTRQIKWGDSMRSKIDDGLRKSKFGVVVLSPDYIKDGKYWTKTELDGLFQIESVNGKMLLPVWHNLTKKEVMEYSPIVASKLAMTTANMTPQEMAKELYKLLSEE